MSGALKKLPAKARGFVNKHILRKGRRNAPADDGGARVQLADVPPPTDMPPPPDVPPTDVPPPPRPAFILGGARARENFTRRQTALQNRFDPISVKLNAVVPPVAATSAELDAATAARATQVAAGTAHLENWSAATRALDVFEAAIGVLETVALGEANKQNAAFGIRFDAIKGGKPKGAVMIQCRVDYLAERKKLTALIAGADGAGALRAGVVVEAALKAFEDAAMPSAQAKAKMVADASSDVLALSDDELRSRTMAEKAEFALNLCANGVPTGEDLKQLCRVYAASPPDPKFTEKRDADRAAIAAAVSKIPELLVLFTDDGKVDRDEWRKLIADPEKVRVLLESVHDEQMKVLGLPKLPVETYLKPKDASGIDMGGFVPGTQKIRLNAHRDAVKSLRETIATMLHETFHAEQDALCKQLMAGEIGPDDENYAQILMFVVNDIGIGYLPPSVNQKDYEAQPTEIDAEIEGQAAATAAMRAIRKARKTATV